VAIVTGASTGIGQASAKALHQAGFRVFGTSRRAIASVSEGIAMIICDVTYLEAARLLVSGGSLVLIGYHPFFLMNGTPTHYHRADGAAVTIQNYVHLFSEHYQAGNNAGLTLVEFQERVIDEDWLLTKPKWREYLHWPVSFALVWRTRKFGTQSPL
jgi:NAD(P)-dependent dehydrogenase (short-subunit alcohol dehydrogenase family)